MSDQAIASNINTKAAQGGVLVKLVIFSLSLAVVPITSYFVSLKYVWNGNDLYAAITAIVAANIVLVAYIITSLLEEKGGVISESQKPAESRKDR